MKKIVLLTVFSILFLSCKDNGVKKPSKLIKEDKMIDIIYDISMLDAINSVNPGALGDNNINSRTYIYKKYAIDSLQFAENSAYYASDLKKYKKMYEAVENRLDENKKIADSLLKMKQEEENKKASELRTRSKDTLEAKNAKKATTFLKKQK
ncbi:DUF4296 domain-containing protein [Flavobacterium lacus]|uniref:Uncharacterized protein DUF4296 n=1 Tax=Flavobacterium lacus TaxID=1353778 RepID=A0A328X2G2_9FLAO|nr:DUF4296 domain-containing protein [Flavobacterium lacus]RAR50384.1 uncharacterized protein DUF4296 [Flavobacterium lacus]